MRPNLRRLVCCPHQAGYYYRRRHFSQPAVGKSWWESLGVSALPNTDTEDELVFDRADDPTKDHRCQPSENVRIRTAMLSHFCPSSQYTVRSHDLICRSNACFALHSRQPSDAGGLAMLKSHLSDGDRQPAMRLGKWGTSAEWRSDSASSTSLSRPELSGIQFAVAASRPPTDPVDIGV